MKRWQQVGPEIFDRARAWGLKVRVSGKFPFELREVYATDEEVSDIADSLCP